MSDPIDVSAGEGKRKHEVDPPDHPNSVGWTHPRRIELATETNPLPLLSGRLFAPVTVEYELYGEISPAADNVILIFHALSGDAHVAGWDADWERDGRPWRNTPSGASWWDRMVGPGKALDTSRYAVLCANVLGSCYGTTGPSSTDPATGRPYGLSFPMVDVGDWVTLIVRLLDHLGIEQVLLAVGGSLGGQQVIELGLAYPDRVRGLAVLAASARLSAQGVALNYAARTAIVNDPHFAGGHYYGREFRPDAGLGVARMIGHITYLSESGMETRFEARRKEPDELKRQLFDPHRVLPRPPGGYRGHNEFDVESYLSYQASGFNERFDPNSYLYITKAMDYYDAARWGEGCLKRAFRRAQGDWLIASFTSDWLYTPAASRTLADALAANLKPVTYINIASDYGHDAFLVEVDVLEKLLTGFLEGLQR